MRACSPKIATPVEINASYALREVALHTRPQGVAGFELRRLLALSCGLERLVMALHEVSANRLYGFEQVMAPGRMALS